ncbi:MAG TPA: hypothetical protein VFT80_00520 [Actinomycetota bacterium]|nr:hypothetical protein [Actinomycetota bacterium]
MANPAIARLPSIVLAVLLLAGCSQPESDPFDTPPRASASPTTAAAAEADLGLTCLDSRQDYRAFRAYVRELGGTTGDEVETTGTLNFVDPYATTPVDVNFWCVADVQLPGVEYIKIGPGP